MVDFIVYYPFLKTYDLQLIEEEKQKGVEIIEEAEEEKKDIIEQAYEKNKDKKIAVLVLCANGATSGMLANAISDGAKQENINLESKAMAYGQHREILDQFDLIILAPQMASMLDELLIETDKVGIKAISTGGKEYVGMTRDSKKALELVLRNI